MAISLRWRMFMGLLVVFIMSGLAVAQDESQFIRGNADVDSLDVSLSVDQSQVNISFSGYVPDACTQIDEKIVAVEGTTITVTVTTRRPTDAFCAQVLTRFEEVVAVPVDSLMPAEYTVNVNGLMANITIVAEASAQTVACPVAEANEQIFDPTPEETPDWSFCVAMPDAYQARVTMGNSERVSIFFTPQANSDYNGVLTIIITRPTGQSDRLSAFDNGRNNAEINEVMLDDVSATQIISNATMTERSLIAVRNGYVYQIRLIPGTNASGTHEALWERLITSWVFEALTMDEMVTLDLFDITILRPAGWSYAPIDDGYALMLPSDMPVVTFTGVTDLPDGADLQAYAAAIRAQYDANGDAFVTIEPLTVANGARGVRVFPTAGDVCQAWYVPQATQTLVIEFQQDVCSDSLSINDYVLQKVIQSIK